MRSPEPQRRQARSPGVSCLPLKHTAGQRGGSLLTQEPQAGKRVSWRRGARPGAARELWCSNRVRRVRPPGQEGPRVRRAPGLGDSALCLTGSFWSGVHGAPGQQTVGLRVSTQDCKNGVFALKAISVGTCHLWEDDRWDGDSGESVPPISPHQALSHGLPSLLAPLTSLCDDIPLPSRDTTAPCDIIHSM